MVRTVTLGNGIEIGLGAYVNAVKVAKANPTTEFKHGLSTWWPVTGAEVVREFRRAINDRISAAVPYNERGAAS